MKKFLSFGAKVRSLILIAFAVIIVAAAGLAIGDNNTNVVIQPSSAASPGWYCYFGKVKGSNHVGENELTASDTGNNYSRFKMTGTTDPFFYPGTSISNTSGGTSGSLNATTNKLVLIRYKLSSSYSGSVTLYYGASSLGNNSGSKGLTPDSTWHDLIIDMTGKTGWSGTLNSFRVDFNGFSKDWYVDIAFIAAFDTLANATSWAGSSITMGTIKTESGSETVTVETTQTTVYFGGANGCTGVPAAQYAGALSKVTAAGSGTGKFTNWECIYLVKDTYNGETHYRIAAHKPYGQANVGGTTVEQWFTNYPGAWVICTQNPAGNAGTAQAFNAIWSYISDTNYIKISGTTLTVYKVSTSTQPTYTTTTVKAPTVNDHKAMDTSGMTGTVSVTGGSTSTGDYSSAPSTMRFYRSNLSQYLKFDGSAATMSFSYSNVAADYQITLSDGTKGQAVAKLAIYYSSDTAATQNNKDGSIQWTYLPAGGSGSVNFQDTSVTSVGSYYDQDVNYSGYATTDGAVYKGNDKYQYKGSFAHQVLPPGRYEARLEYDVLFDKYVVIQCSTSTGIAADPFDGNNMREWPGAAQLKQGSTGINDTDGLITTVPMGVDIYVGYDSTDKSTADYWTKDVAINNTAKAGTMSLYGGVFHPGDANGNAYDKSRVWRMAKFVYEGVIYEGWIDTGLTNYATVVATSSNIKTTSSASAATMVMIPRKHKNTDTSYNYGQWVPLTHEAASSSEFLVRWSWSFNTEDNVKNFTKSNNTAETQNGYYNGAQVEYNSNNFLTLTSTSASGSTANLRMSHVFTKTQTYDDYDVDKAAEWNSSNVIAPNNNGTGLCRVDWDDPVNSNNAAGDGAKTAYMGIVYRTQDKVADSNVIGVYMSPNSAKNGGGGGWVTATITCDGTWRTAVITLTSATGWKNTAENSTAGSAYNGLRYNDMTYMILGFFSTGAVPGGKSIDIASVGIFDTSDEATKYGTAYISKNLATQKGLVRVISNANGTVTLTKGGSGTLSSDSTYLTGVTAGSTFKVNVTPAAGYYCSKLCWRPTGYTMSGGNSGGNKTTYFSPGTGGNSSTASANHANVIEYVDVLDGNFMNNGMFTADTASAAGWQNSTWGTKEIMTPAQISAYNSALVKKYLGSTRNDAQVEILDMSAKEKITTANIQSYVNTACTEANATTWGLSAAYTNRNYSAIDKANIQFGVVTKRSTIRALPTSSSYIDGSSHNLVCESGIAYATPVWVLHTSTDGKFYFVQAPYYRGWVDATAIATTTAYMDWIEFAEPEIRGDVVVTTARTVTINSQTAEMGCVFQHVSTSSSTYTVKIPVRNEDGTLGSSTSTALTTSNSSLGYLPYTWNNYVGQAFKYLGQAYSWADENVGRVDCSAFAQYVLKTFGFKIMRNTSQQAGTGYTDIMNSKSYSYSTDNYYDLAKFGGTPMILTGNGHTVLYLGMVGYKHYIIHSPSVGKNVMVEELTDANLAKWSTYAIYAPNNYLEDAYVRRFLTGTAKTFTATLETPATGTWSAGNKTINHAVDAVVSTSLDNGTTYADQYVLNSGGRDIYVWAEFSPIKHEIALDIQLQIPDGYGLPDDYHFGSVRLGGNMKCYSTVTEVAHGSTPNTRLIVYQGYKVTSILTDGGLSRNTTNASTSATGNNGTVDTAITTYTDERYGSGSTWAVNASKGPAYPSYDVADTMKLTEDGSLTYIIQPTSYTIKYNSDYPSDSGVSSTTVTGTHYYNCAGNKLEGSAKFTASEGPNGKWSASKTFSAGSHYKFLGWATNASTASSPNKVSYTSDAANATAAKNYATKGTQGATYNLYARWAPINYSLSVEFVSQVDRELIGTPDGFCVKVGSNSLGKNDVVNSQTPLTLDLSSHGTLGKNLCETKHDSATGILSINSTSAGDVYCSIDIASPTSYNIVKYKYLSITYKMTGSVPTNKIYFMTNSDTAFGVANGSAYANWIADGEWHTMTLNMAEVTRFFLTNQYLKSLRLPGSTSSGGTLDVASVKLYQNPPSIWGESITPNASGTATALTKQGDYGFNHTINTGVGVNVISAQQADYGFVMDIQKAYMIFYKSDITATASVYTSAQYSSSGWNTTFGTPVNVTVNGVTALGYDVTKYIKNHTFDMAAANFTMPACDVRLVFVCDYMHYAVNVYACTAGAKYGTLDTATKLTANATTVSKTFTQGKVTIAASKNNGILGRYGSTIKLTAATPASGYKFLGWYEKVKDATTTTSGAYGKLISSSATFTLSENLHKDMEIVAVYGSSTSTNTTFNFCNSYGQIIQTIVAAKDTYIPVSNITAKPYKAHYVFNGWQFMKNADKSKVKSVSIDPDGDGTKSTYYKLDGTAQPTYKYDYIMIYSDKNCTKPVYILTTSTGGKTVSIDGSYTRINNSKMTIKVSGTAGTVNGAASVSVYRDAQITAKATGTGTFKGWVDLTYGTTAYVEGAYTDGTKYYPYVSYSKTYTFRAIRGMTLLPVYNDSSVKAPMIHMPNYMQLSNMGTYYKYTVNGFVTVDCDTKFEILEWGSLFFLAPDASTLPTTVSFDKATGATITKNTLTTGTESSYLQMNSNSSSDQMNIAGQFAASVNVASARTIYIRLYLRYSYVDATTGETMYGVTYSQTNKYTSAAFDASTASTYLYTSEGLTLYDVADFDPKDYDGDLF